MFKTAYNQAKLSFTVEPVTPLLIRSGREAFDPTRPDLEFIHIGSPYDQVVYIPGSSVKGVMRSYAEKILRTLGLWTCDISGESCSKRKSEQERKLPYKEHCYACRTFGSTELASRFRIGDAYPWRWDMTEEEKRESLNRIKTDLRPGIAIDRKKGTVKPGALFELEVVSTGTFYGEILIRNYQLWQLALTALVIRDIDEGYQQLGLAKSRGLGRVRTKVSSFELMQLGPLSEREEIYGVGEVEGLNGRYDLIKEDKMAMPSKLRAETGGFFRKRFVPYEGERPEEVWQEFAEALVNSQNWQKLLKEGRGFGTHK